MAKTDLIERLRASGPFRASDGHMALRVPSSKDAHEAADLIEALKAAFVRLAIPTAALLMDKGSHKYITPEILNEWEHALQDGEAALGVSGARGTEDQHKGGLSE